MKIAIIGGGASGLIAGIYAKNKNNTVTIFERNLECGKKILVTGNGRCNYWNENFSLDFFHSKHEEILSNLITEENKDEIMNFFEKIGILPKIKNGYFYPMSNQAVSIRDALVVDAKKRNVIFKTNYLVKNIKKEDEKFIINDELIFDKVILATGGCSLPKTGSDGSGYMLAKTFSHNIEKPLPSLVQLVSKGNFLYDWAGIRCDAGVSIYKNQKFQKKEFGEIQLTDYGVSGICVFNLSRIASIGLDNCDDIKLKIDFLPSVQEPLEKWLKKRNEQLLDRNIYELLNGLLNKKLIKVILKLVNIDLDEKYDDISNVKRKELVNRIKNFELSVVGVKDFSMSQVTIGGVSLSEINPDTLESNIVKGLYFIGEVLDVDADCGGYNLGFAWISGMIAGKGIRDSER